MKMIHIKKKCRNKKKQKWKQNTVNPLYSHPSGPKKNGVIIKILYDVTKERGFLISLLVTRTNVNVLIRRDMTISGVTIERVDCS